MTGPSYTPPHNRQPIIPGSPSTENPSTPAASMVYHPALNVTNIRSLVPLTLDGDKVQYNPWSTLFHNTARAYTVLDHIDSTVVRPSEISDELWSRLDATLKSISDQLTTLDHPISEDRLVLQLVGKLTAKYNMVATLIQQSIPLPSFAKPCSMLELDRTSREKNQKSTTSSSSVLIAQPDSSQSSSTSTHPSSSGGHGASRGYRGKKNNGGRGNNNGGGCGNNQQQQQ
uniref:Uncharacterized protein n=1 Tax=Chenopodium quinoa TaxID=63459 RepID=A0A803KQ75_CHEQI